MTIYKGNQLISFLEKLNISSFDASPKIKEEFITKLKEELKLDFQDSTSLLIIEELWKLKKEMVFLDSQIEMGRLKYEAIRQKIQIDKMIEECKEWKKDSLFLDKLDSDIKMEKIVFHYKQNGKYKRKTVNNLPLIWNYIELIYNKIYPEIKIINGAPHKAFNLICNKYTWSIYLIIKDDNYFKTDGLISNKIYPFISDLLLSVDINYSEDNIKNYLRKSLKV